MNKNSLIELNHTITEISSLLLNNYISRIKKNENQYIKEIKKINDFIEQTVSYVGVNDLDLENKLDLIAENSTKYILYLKTLNSIDLEDSAKVFKMELKSFNNSITAISEITKDILFSIIKLDKIEIKNLNNEYLNLSFNKLKEFVEQLNYESLININITQEVPKISPLIEKMLLNQDNHNPKLYILN